MLVDTSAPSSIDKHGVLGVATLRLKRIHFDFARGLVSWERSERVVSTTKGGVGRSNCHLDEKPAIRRLESSTEEIREG